MTYADGIDWHIGTEVLPLQGSVTIAKFRGQKDSERVDRSLMGRIERWRKTDDVAH